MIPVSLNLKNFLSYGDQVPTLDFTPLHVVCLSGDNGHGKSALLDAMTWAVWGEARKASGDRKPDDRLLRMGTTDMAVEFVFQLEGDRYRILRQYRSGRSGKSNLEFQIYSQESEAYFPLTKPSITATQATIIDVLRMDYKTFTNSVFVLQGRADEFTNRSARERKEILADILGLWRYEDLRDRSRLHMQRAEQVRNECDRHLADIDAALTDQKDCLNSIESLESGIRQIEKQQADIDQKLGELGIRQARFKDAAIQIIEQQTRHKTLNDEHLEFSKQMTALNARVDSHRKALSERDQIEHAYRDFQTISKEYEQLNKKAQTDRQLEQRKTELVRSIEAERHEIERQKQLYVARRESAERAVEETMNILAKGENIENGVKDLFDARRDDDKLERNRIEHDALQQRLRALRDQAATLQTALQGEIGGFKLRLTELNRKSKILSKYKQDVSENTVKLAELRIVEEEQVKISEKGQELNGQVELLKNKIRMYEHEDADVDTKLNMLRRGVSTNCPLCDAQLDDHRRDSIEVNLGESIKNHAEEIQKHQERIRLYQEERERLVVLFKKTQPRLKALPELQQALAAADAGVRESSEAANEIIAVKKQVRALEDKLNNGAFAPDLHRNIRDIEEQIVDIGYSSELHVAAKNKLRDLQHFESDKSRLDDASSRYKTANDTLAPTKEKLEELDRQLNEEAYALESRQHLKTLLGEISALGYAEAHHKNVENRINSLKDVVSKKTELELAVRQFDESKESLADFEKRTAKLKEEIHQVSKRIEELKEGTTEAEQIESELVFLRNRRSVLQREQDEANRQLGGEQQRALRFKKMATERPEIKECRDKASQDVQVYEKLATAFGKDGIQALIIETAIPEIEEETNRILSRLTGNRTQITIEPLRNLKTGGTRETLDIHISDEMGTRPYEMYSGGEAFRTNFALRIALSKLLAHRAGTRLLTLVIDEGFGTQDAEGLEFLIEALQGIKDDFEKIIVVTHLDRLKDAFPARIEVVKQPDTGSVFEVFV